MNILIYAAIIVVGLIVLGVILTRLYRRSTKERGFVRTGLGGQKVVLNGGAIVIGMFHEIMEVSLTTLKLTVERRTTQALLTNDRLRVDVGAEFYVRVKPDSESVALAAQTLGRRTLNPDLLKELLEGKFVDALRSVASSLTMDQMHENRADFVQKVQQTVAADLATNGLELESVSLTSFDQTDIQYFNEGNAFDAVGRALVIETVEDRKRATNDIQAKNRVAIAERNLEAKRRELEIDQEQKFAIAQQEAEVARNAAERMRETEEARINSEQAIAQKEISGRQATQTRQIETDQAIAIARQAQNIAVSEKSRDESRAKAEADEARAQAVAAEEGVITAQKTAVADREKKVALVEASRVAEQSAISIRVNAEAERDAATARAEAQRIEAQGFADAETLRANATKARMLAEAEGAERINAAANNISPEQLAFQREIKLFESLPAIIDAAGKPLEKIESIRIAEVSGLGGGSNGLVSDGPAGAGPMGLGDEITRSALRYQTASPMIQSLLGSVGLDGKSLGSLASSVTGAPEAPAAEPSAPAAKGEGVNLKVEGRQSPSNPENEARAVDAVRSRRGREASAE